MDTENKIYELARLRGEDGRWLLGRKGILSKVSGVSEWKVRNVIKEVRGESIPGKQAPTPEERVKMQREAEQVKLPQIVIKVPKLSEKKAPKKTTETWVFGSDFHAPYHHEPSCNIFYNVISDLQPDKVIVLGDLLNLDQFSRYPGEGKYPGAPTWIEEIAESGKILGNIKQAAPNASLEWFEGNHEMRLKKHLMREDPILYGKIDISKLFLLSDNEHAITSAENFKYIDTPEIFHSDLNLIVKHGEKVRKHSGMSAAAEIDELLISVIMGHCHRLGLYRKSSGRSRYMNQQPLFGIETGCLCKYDIPYREGSTSNWQHGFGILEIDRSGSIPLIEPAIVEINNKKALFRGKVYNA